MNDNITTCGHHDGKIQKNYFGYIKKEEGKSGVLVTDYKKFVNGGLYNGFSRKNRS